MLQFSPFLILGVFQIGVFFLICYLVTLFFNRLQNSQLVVLMLLSPAGLLASAYTIGMSLRKEILFMLALSVVLVPVLNGLRLPGRWLGLGIALYAVSVFAHEGMVFFAPFFLFVVLIYWRIGAVSRAVALASVLTIIGVAVLAFAVSMRFAHSDPEAVCAAVLARGLTPYLCGGAIRWMNTSLAEGIAFTDRSVFQNYRYLSFLVYYILAMLPFLNFRGERKEARWLVVAFWPGVLFLAPLFIVASDWERWIAEYVFGCILLSFALLKLGWFSIRRVWPTWLALLYVSSWSFPYFIHHIGFNGLFLPLVAGLIWGGEKTAVLLGWPRRGT